MNLYSTSDLSEVIKPVHGQEAGHFFFINLSAEVLPDPKQVHLKVTSREVNIHAFFFGITINF